MDTPLPEVVTPALPEPSPGHTMAEGIAFIFDNGFVKCSRCKAIILNYDFLDHVSWHDRPAG